MDAFWNASWKQSSQQHSASHVPVEHYKKDKTYEGNEEIYFYQRQIIRKLHPVIVYTRVLCEKAATYLNLFALNIIESTTLKTKKHLHSKSIQNLTKRVTLDKDI